jgi:D-3-phosphoglycerate dehydrogenase
MKILIVGDEFINSKLLKKHLDQHLKPIMNDLRYEEMNFKSTDITTKTYQDIDEYWGDDAPLINKIGDCGILVVVDAPVTQKVIEAGTKLRVIGCTRGGPVNVNIKEATRRGIPVLNTVGRNADAVADFTIGLMLVLMRKIVNADQFLRNGDWKRNKQDTFEKPTGPELCGKRVGIVGYGQVGQKVARRLMGFDTEILVYDPNVPREIIENAGCACVDLDKLLNESDVVSLHLRLPRGKAGWFDLEKFKSMKRTSYLINASRGYIINEADLTKALRENLISGAAVDVFVDEPISLKSELLKLDNVILTPHVAGISNEVPEKSSKIIAEQIAKYLRGERPENTVNPEVLR